MTTTGQLIAGLVFGAALVSGVVILWDHQMAKERARAARARKMRHLRLTRPRRLDGLHIIKPTDSHVRVIRPKEGNHDQY